MAAYVSSMFNRFESEVFNDPARFPLVDNSQPLPAFSIPLSEDLLGSEPQLPTEGTPPQPFSPALPITPTVPQQLPQPTLGPVKPMAIKDRLAAIIARYPTVVTPPSLAPTSAPNNTPSVKGFVNLPSAKSPIAPNILPASIA